MSCQTLGASADYCINEEIKFQDFRKDVRTLLKKNGFKKCRFDTTRVTIKGGAFGDYKVIRLNAIYFDK